MSRGVFGRALVGSFLLMIVWVVATVMAGDALGGFAPFAPAVGIGLFAVVLCVLVCARVGGLGASWPWGLVLAPTLLDAIGVTHLALGLSAPAFQIVFSPPSWVGQVLACLAIPVFLARHPDDQPLLRPTAMKLIALACIAILALDAALGLQSTVLGVLVRDKFSTYFTGGRLLVLTGPMMPVLALVLSVAFAAILFRYRRERPPQAPVATAPEGPPATQPSLSGPTGFGRRGLS